MLHQLMQIQSQHNYMHELIYLEVLAQQIFYVRTAFSAIVCCSFIMVIPDLSSFV